jgi:hypothetical protein
MHRTRSLLVLGSLVLGTVVHAAAPPKAIDWWSKTDEQIARMQRFLTRTKIDARDLPEEMLLPDLLAVLQARLPAGPKMSLKIDEEELGKELRTITVTTSHLRTQHATLDSVLRRALLYLDKPVDIEFAVRPDGIVLTRPRLAVHRTMYDIHDVLRALPTLLPELQRQAPQALREVEPTDSADILVRFLMSNVELRPWETVHLLNDVRLVVVASPTHHEEVEDLLQMLRRLADSTVIMNARIYEVDRAFYTKHVAPLFAQAEGSDDRPIVVAIGGPLLKRISKEKLVLQSEDRQLRPHQRVGFLSWKSGLRLAVPAGAATTGVSFEVRPRISPDRRYLRLHLWQTATQFAGTNKLKTLDVASGKDVEVEPPHIRKTALTGTIQIPDSQPILMPVSCGLPESAGKHKVWLLVARPFIWIEEEFQEGRNEGGDLTPESIWDSEVPKEEPPPPAMASW